MSEEMNKKTGATPVVPLEDLSGGRVTGVISVSTVLVRFSDGFGKQITKLAVVIPGGEIYFFKDNSLDQRPVQQWLRNSILSQLAKNPQTNLVESKEDDSQV